MKVKVNVPLVNIRKEPKKAKDNIIRKAEKDEIFDFVKNEKKWTKTNEGFIMSEFLDEVKEEKEDE